MRWLNIEFIKLDKSSLFLLKFIYKLTLILINILFIIYYTKLAMLN